VIEYRPANERGRSSHGWLESFHTFSFADYHDPSHMGLGPLRVINDDTVQPGRGFGKHGHRDMEILSYVLDGELAHEDSLGNGSVIVPGDVQRMSAGTGVIHSEFNPSRDRPVHFLQIWIEPASQGLPPGYEQKHVAAERKRGRLALIASPDGREGSVTVRQDARVYAALLDGGERAGVDLDAGRRGYVQVARGRVKLGEATLSAGDGAALHGPARLELHGGMDAEVLVFDLP
jgi:redox-sensitive bicupin YhaK (pirin superfamily)